MTGETSWDKNIKSPRKPRLIKPRNILETRERTYNDPDPNKPRISEQFANQFLDDILAFTIEDHITFRQIFKTMDEKELEETRAAINKLTQHISDIKRIRKVRVMRELRETNKDLDTEGG